MPTSGSWAVVNAVMTALLATGAILTTPGSSVAQGQSEWSGTSSGSGIGLMFGPRGGDPVFSLACLRGTREVLAIAYTVRPEPGREEARTMRSRSLRGFWVG